MGGASAYIFSNIVMYIQNLIMHQDQFISISSKSVMCSVQVIKVIKEIQVIQSIQSIQVIKVIHETQVIQEMEVLTSVTRLSSVF